MGNSIQAGGAKRYEEFFFFETLTLKQLSRLVSRPLQAPRCEPVGFRQQPRRGGSVRKLGLFVSEQQQERRGSRDTWRSTSVDGLDTPTRSFLLGRRRRVEVKINKYWSCRFSWSVRTYGHFFSAALASASSPRSLPAASSVSFSPVVRTHAFLCSHVSSIYSRSC